MKIIKISTGTLSRCIALLAFVSLIGCGGGEGTLTLTIWGEDFIEDKIPASEVEDGWQITITKFLIVAGQLNIASTNGQEGPTYQESKLFDLRQKGPHTWRGSTAIAAGTWDALSYTIDAATDNTTKGNASDDDLQMMKQNKYSIYMEGTATKDAQTKTFAWGFSTNTTYKDCKPQKPAIQAGTTASMQMTIHADHFFYDDLESPEAKVRFAAIAAADKDNDGKITLEELAAVKGADFARLSDYGVGRFTQVTDLKAFITQLSRTLGHIDGEGHCEVAL